MIPRYSDGFNVNVFSKELKVPLKFLVQNQFYNYKNKFNSLPIKGIGFFAQFKHL